MFFNSSKYGTTLISLFQILPILRTFKLFKPILKTAQKRYRKNPKSNPKTSPKNNIKSLKKDLSNSRKYLRKTFLKKKMPNNHNLNLNKSYRFPQNQINFIIHHLKMKRITPSYPTYTLIIKPFIIKIPKDFWQTMTLKNLWNKKIMNFPCFGLLIQELRIEFDTWRSKYKKRTKLSHS